MKYFYLLIILLFCIINFVNCNTNEETCEDETKSQCSATYYTTPDNGACGYQGLYSQTGPKTNKIVALSTKYFNGALSCGVCFMVYQNNTTPVKVIVTDECPAQYNQEHCSGPNAHFDLSQEAFQQLAELRIGVLSNLQYQMVPCDSDGNLKVKTKEGSNNNWAGFMVFNHRVGVQSLAIQIDPNQGYKDLARTTYNYFLASDNLAGSYLLKITSIFGEEIIVKMNGVQPGGITDSGQQYTKFDECDLPPIYSSGFTVTSSLVLIITTVLLSLLI